MTDTNPATAERDDSDRLKCCPHCASDAEVNQTTDGGYFVECLKCGASTSLVYATGDDPLPMLMERWNRRAAVPASEPVDVKAIHSAVLALQCNPANSVEQRVAFLAGVHRSAAVVSQFATQPAPVSGMPDLQRQRDWKLATAVRDWYLVNYPQMHGFVEQAPIAELIAALPAPQAPDTPNPTGETK
jgi:hypothetical protein